MTSQLRPQRRRLHLPLLATAVLDAVMILVFSTGGRESHEKALSAVGVVQTAAPFLVGAALGWVLAYVLVRIETPSWLRAEEFRPERILPFGIVVWISAVVVGMLLRALFHTGTAPQFIGVATLSLCVLLLGWRAVADRVYRMFAR
ncbi:hypothetical protein GOARA_068_00870 [Gordonia araii NBRC 100433]|uniref:DUF3054 domain-containing protein n=1 Tax=Gordonia araii NBRC 100433 TaxID=1073574 RepID=G7H6F3_9ACTN|nr:DUF3054 domain-containing protein [Gordonia araii]NNG96108.1 DUF3054 domain-containing protein [Gordonia araii NBRC 100433]GAB11428.1 hypothetical protein GOARA_068_00870 [Gordonia araii NBRC 100433]